MKTGRQGLLLVAIVLCLLLTLSRMAMAAPGDLDTSFNGVGKVTTAIGAGNDNGLSVAVQSDGKIVVAGYSNNGANNDFAVVRYNGDGSLDTSFNSTGKVTTAIGAGNDNGQSVAVQSDGKIVVAGYSNNGANTDFAVVRYNGDGSLDTSFNSTGKVTTAIGAGNENGQSVALQPDGKIVVAGISSIGANTDVAVVRYNGDGSLDTSFNGTGMVTTAIGGGHDLGNSVAVQSDGKIVTAGASVHSIYYDLAVVRYNGDGSLDTSFNGAGMVTTAIGANSDIGQSVAVQSDGKIVVAGYSNNGADNDFTVVRYNGDGSLDTSFNGSGMVTTAIGASDDQAYSVAVQSDGKIVVAGYSNNGADNDFTVVRYNSDGSLDTSFNGAGMVTTAIGGGHDQGYSVAVQSDGKIVVAGYSNNGANNDFAVVRYLGAVAATLTTTAISNITLTTAVSGGSISSDGGAAITARGVCWNTTGNPTIADAITTDGAGAFVSSLVGLTSSTTYYLRAYATNEAGTSYGQQLAFRTLSLVPTMTLEGLALLAFGLLGVGALRALRLRS